MSGRSPKPKPGAEISKMIAYAGGIIVYVRTFRRAKDGYVHTGFFTQFQRAKDELDAYMKVTAQLRKEGYEV